MKTRKQAEARALELFPKTHIATVNQLHEVSRDAFLQCFDEMQVPINPQEAKDRALEIFPVHEEFDVDRLKPLREAFLAGVEWEKERAELPNEKHSESLDTKENEGSELPSEKQKELLCEMMRKDEASGMYELTKEVEMIECPDCNGEGTWYNDTSRQCTTYRGDCCGGCGYDVDCDTCNGTGEIEEE